LFSSHFSFSCVDLLAFDFLRDSVKAEPLSILYVTS
jgi:hypothetical protein